MADNEIKKTEDTKVIKIKAIYPHIVVGGTVNKPCYSIDWYDIEAQTMHTGYSSYNLKNVQEWLKEHFEVVEYDIENLINRLQAENERLKKENENFADIGKMYSEIKAEAYKEFAEKAVEQVEKARQKYQRLCKEQGEEMEEHMHIHFNGITKIIINLLKEMVGLRNEDWKI